MKRSLWIGLGVLSLLSMTVLKADAETYDAPTNITPTSFEIDGITPNSNNFSCLYSFDGGTTFNTFPCGTSPNSSIRYTFDQSLYPNITPNAPINLALTFIINGQQDFVSHYPFWTQPEPAGSISEGQEVTCTTITVLITNQNLQQGNPGNPRGTDYAVTVTAPGGYTQTNNGQFLNPNQNLVTLTFNNLPDALDIGVYKATATVIALNSYRFDRGTGQGPDSKTLSVSFQMICNPVPILTQIIPSSAVIGSPVVPLTVEGTLFMSGAEVLWNNEPPIPISSINPSSTTVTANIPASYLNYVGIASVTVLNPEPTDGPSNILQFNITPPGPPIAKDIIVNVDYTLPAPFQLIGITQSTTSLKYVADSQPVDGTIQLTPSNGSGVYQAIAQKLGIFNSIIDDTFTYHVTDGFGQISNEASCFLHISPPKPPVAVDVSASTTLNTPVGVVLQANDPYPGMTLTWQVLTQPTHGTESGIPPNLTYQPNNGFTGVDSFTFNVTDSFGQLSNTGTATITVSTPVPTADVIYATVPFNTPTSITLSGSPGQAGLTLTYTALTQPVNGQIVQQTLGGPIFVYTPNHNYVGADTFTYETYNGYLYSSPASVFITVLQSTELPKAFPVTVTTPYNTVVGFSLNVVNPSGLPLTYSMTSPANGQVTGNPPNLAYTPNPGFSGTDGFTYYAIAGGDLQSNTAPVTITVGQPIIGGNPPPQLDSLVPSSAAAGGYGFPLVLNGKNFALGAVVTWNGSDRIASGSATQMTASILTSDIGLPNANSVAMVQVINPDGKASNALPFTILPAPATGPADYIIVEPNGTLIYATQSQQFTGHYIHNGNVIPGVTFLWNLRGNANGTISPVGYFSPSPQLQGRQVFTVEADAYGISGTASVTVVPIGASLTGDICGAFGYPVPYKSTMNLPGITFTQLAESAEIRMYTADGRPVRTLLSVGGENVLWDLRNGDGGKVASGVYLYIIKQPSGSTCGNKSGKLVILQ